MATDNTKAIASELRKMNRYLSVIANAVNRIAPPDVDHFDPDDDDDVTEDDLPFVVPGNRYDDDLK